MASEAHGPAGDTDVRRLHPTTLLFSFLGHVKGFLLPLLVVLSHPTSEFLQLQPPQ